VPALLLGPVAGVFADRWDRRLTMLTADLLRAASVALMLLVHHPGQIWLVYLALILESSFSQFFNPAAGSLIPALVGRGPRLNSANSLAALIGGTVRLVGGPLGGALYALAGFAPVVTLDAGSYLASALLITLIGHHRQALEPAEPLLSAGPAAPLAAPLRQFARELRAGAGHIRDTPGLVALFTAAGVFFAGNAAFTALLVPYIGTVLHAGTDTLGVLFGALGVGYLVGAPLSRAAAAHLSERTVMAASLAALGVVLGGAFAVRDTAWDLVIFTLIGPPGVCFLTTASTYLARRTPDHLLGRATSAYGMLSAAATLTGMLAGSALGQTLGIAVTANLAALAVFASAIAALRIPRPAAAAAPPVHVPCRDRS